MKLSQNGMSLVEILIGLTITSIVGFVLVGIITSSNSFFIDQTIKVDQGLSLNTSVREISDLIKSSGGVVSQYPISGAPQYQSGINVLVLKLPAISATEQVIDSVFDYAIIVKEPIDSKVLRVKVFPDNLSSRKAINKVLSTSLETIKFLYLDTNNNQVSSSQAVRVNFIINLSDIDGLADNESSSSGVVNIKNN